MNDADESRSLPIVPLAVAAVLGIALLIGILWLGRPEVERPEPPVSLPPLEGEAARYAAEQIEMGTISLSRWENFLGQQVTYVDGTVTNNGRRSVAALELTLEFNDIMGQVVLRETVRAVGQPTRSGTQAAPLKAGESRAFRLGLEHIPAVWNRGAPRITVTGLLLE